MAHVRQMLTKAEMAAIEVRNKRADKRAKRMAEAVRQARENAKLKAKAARKSASSSTKPMKLRRSWECMPYKRSDISKRLVREVAHSFRPDL